MSLTPRQLCNVVYAYLVQDQDKDGRAELDNYLARPVDAKQAEAERRFYAEINKRKRG